MKLFFNKTKIIATVGPASATREKLLELMVAGVDVFRLNFSHGSYEEHAQVVSHIRELNDKFNFHVGILLDLQGPKIRIGEVENGGVLVEKDQEVVFTVEKCLSNAKRVYCTYESLPSDVKAGDTILIDDGKLEFTVTEVSGGLVHARVVFGGMLKSKKGMNLPNTDISAPSLTDKDYQDVLFGIKHKVEWIALSFVRQASDMLRLREIINNQKGFSHIIAKIERPEAINNIDSIIEASDAVMVARGDLGVEIKAEDVPLLQKRIVRKANEAGKPVIIATQMMESMITNPRPTRAETNDIANAVMDGADALMLSGETAVGKYPVEVVKSVMKTIHSMEVNAESIYNRYYEIDPSYPDFIARSVLTTACRLAQNTQAKAILSMTQSGYTAFRIASHRPKARIFIFTGNARLLTTVSLIWGVRGFFYDRFVSTDITFKETQQILVDNGLLEKGDLFINTASMPINEKQRTNVVKLSKVD
ncbi:pyruvate kinase [Hugenholtzia roseola]|uniref:pyruvate kinase n=1 Tax=Hugenholtzia roseola TaxID=1002 RepID=UPI0003F9AC61|nr:pyruvate kinase [Hugenholtzia roseola]